MSLNINVILEGIFLSLFLAYSTIGMSLKLQFYYKRWTERTTLESSLNRSYAGCCVKPGLLPWLMAWGRRELPLQPHRHPSPPRAVVYHCPTPL